MPHPMFLFDIDGTLVDTGGAGIRAMHAAAQQLFNGHLSFEGIDTAGRLDIALFSEAAVRSGYTEQPGDLSRLREVYADLLKQELKQSADRVRALPGTLDLLTRLQQKVRSSPDDSPVVGCLTGNFGVAARIKLRATGFDPAWFTITAFGDEAETRPGLTALALRRYAAAYGQGADPQRVVVIGDTPHDIDCAHAHGCVAFAVATGRFSREELEAAGADVVVEDFADPAELLEYL